MKVNPLYQRKMYNVSVQITKTPKKQRNERIKEHKRQNRYSLPTKRQLSRTNLNRLPPPFEIHSHQIPLPFLQQHFQLGPFVLSLFSQIYKHIHSNAPNFEPKPNCQSFFTSQIEPSHQDNLDTTKNRGRKSRNKGIEREKGEANGYQWWWWSSRVRPWLRRERESEIAERGSETELVVEGYKSGGCGGVFVSWIEA